MTTQVNFSELKQRVSMENLLGHYGLLDGMKRVKQYELVGLCPLHEETRGSFHVSTSKDVWNCFGCDGKGNILDLVMAKENVGIRAAGLMIQEWFSGSPQSAPETPKKRDQLPSGDVEPKADGNPALTLRPSPLLAVPTGPRPKAGWNGPPIGCRTRPTPGSTGSPVRPVAVLRCSFQSLLPASDSVEILHERLA